MTGGQVMGIREWRALATASLFAATIGMAVPVDAAAQQTRVIPTNQVVISGYGTVGYQYGTQGENENAFTASINPILLFQFLDRILFEIELEFELEEGITETGLEYAQVDFLLNDNLTLVGGKFLVPFGIFGTRLHPTWINKFPTSPPLYGHDVANAGAPPLMPVIADIGFMVRAMLRPGPFHLNLNGYISQGASAEDPTEEIPELVFQGSSSDNNTSKMVGGRIDFALPPWVEVNVSYLNGDYDDNNLLDLTGWNIGGEFRRGSFEFRGEYMQIRQEIEQLSGFPTLRRHGFYAQGSYRIGSWEPVVRWTQLFDDKLDGALQSKGVWQAGFALDYWFAPSIVFMAGFELNNEFGPELDNNRVVTHVAYGF